MGRGLSSLAVLLVFVAACGASRRPLPAVRQAPATTTITTNEPVDAGNDETKTALFSRAAPALPALPLAAEAGRVRSCSVTRGPVLPDRMTFDPAAAPPRLALAHVREGAVAAWSDGSEIHVARLDKWLAPRRPTVVHPLPLENVTVVGLDDRAALFGFAAQGFAPCRGQPSCLVAQLLGPEDVIGAPAIAVLSTRPELAPAGAGGHPIPPAATLSFASVREAVASVATISDHSDGARIDEQVLELPWASSHAKLRVPGRDWALSHHQGQWMLAITKTPETAMLSTSWGQPTEFSMASNERSQLRATLADGLRGQPWVAVERATDGACETWGFDRDRTWSRPKCFKMDPTIDAALEWSRKPGGGALRMLRSRNEGVGTDAVPLAATDILSDSAGPAFGALTWHGDRYGVIYARCDARNPRVLELQTALVDCKL